MSSATRSTPLDPITPDNAVVLIVDQQEGWFSSIFEPEQTQRHLLALARNAVLHPERARPRLVVEVLHRPIHRRWAR